ncbi:hypothetical protein V2G26_020838 [Clonostachys chloroleuca]
MEGWNSQGDVARQFWAHSQSLSCAAFSFFTYSTIFSLDIARAGRELQPGAPSCTSCKSRFWFSVLVLEKEILSNAVSLGCFKSHAVRPMTRNEAKILLEQWKRARW